MNTTQESWFDKFVITASTALAVRLLMQMQAAAAAKIKSRRVNRDVTHVSTFTGALRQTVTLLQKTQPITRGEQNRATTK